MKLLLGNIPCRATAAAVTLMLLAATSTNAFTVPCRSSKMLTSSTAGAPSSTSSSRNEGLRNVLFSQGTGVDYLSNLGGGGGGGRPSSPAKNYSGVGRTFRPSGSPSSNSYLDSVASSGPMKSSNYNPTHTAAPPLQTPPPMANNYQHSTSSHATTTTNTNFYAAPGPAHSSSSNSYSTNSGGASYTYVPPTSAPATSSTNSGGASYTYVPPTTSPATSSSSSTATYTYVPPPPPPPAPPVITSSPSYATASSSSSSLGGPVDYMKSLGGGNSMKSGHNYSGMWGAFRTSSTSGSSYLDKVATSPPVTFNYNNAYASSTPPPPVVNPTTYNYNAYASAPAPPAVNPTTYSTSPSPSSFYTSPVPPAVAPPAPAYSPSFTTASPATNTGTNYLGGLSGGNAMKSGSNYSGMSGSYRPTSSSPSYLDQVNGAVQDTTTYKYIPPPPAFVTDFDPKSTPVPTIYPVPPAKSPAPSGADYLSGLGGSAARTSGSNYAGMSGSYLDAVSHAVPFSYNTAPAPSAPKYQSAAPGGSGGMNYLGGLGGGNAMKSGQNYSGMGGSFRTTTKHSTYLEKVGDAAPVEFSYAPSPTIPIMGRFNLPSSAPAFPKYEYGVVDSNAGYVNGLGGGGNAMKSGRNYSGYTRNNVAKSSSTPRPAPAPIYSFGIGPPSSPYPAYPAYVPKPPVYTSQVDDSVSFGGDILESQFIGPVYPSPESDYPKHDTFENYSTNVFYDYESPYEKPPISPYVTAPLVIPPNNFVNYMGSRISGRTRLMMQGKQKMLFVHPSSDRNVNKRRINRSEENGQKQSPSSVKNSFFSDSVSSTNHFRVT